MTVRYQGIIFDFNGVLLWDTDWHVQAWRIIAKQLRDKELTAAEFEQHLHGRSTAAILQYLANRPLERSEFAALIEAKESLYRERCVMNPKRFMLSPGARELLDFLMSHHIPRTIATSSELTNVQFYIQHLNLNRWFDGGRIQYDNGVRPAKPAPDLYLEAARAINLAPHFCVAIEDTEIGLAAAQAAGVGYLVALGPPATHERLSSLPGVSLVIQSLRDVPRELFVGPANDGSTGQPH